jgi:hypothetical protein
MRKLLTFLVALAAIVFAVGSPASAQVGGLGFPGPGLGHFVRRLMLRLDSCHA